MSESLHNSGTVHVAECKILGRPNAVFDSLAQPGPSHPIFTLVFLRLNVIVVVVDVDDDDADNIVNFCVLLLLGGENRGVDFDLAKRAMSRDINLCSLLVLVDRRQKRRQQNEEGRANNNSIN
jgi:hypothetical protein